MNIDTSTTAGKIAVMQASIDGKIIQIRKKTTWSDYSANYDPTWCWNDCGTTYRIKPQSLQDAAEEIAERMFTDQTDKNTYMCGFGDGSRWQKNQDQ